MTFLKFRPNCFEWIWALDDAFSRLLHQHGSYRLHTWIQCFILEIRMTVVRTSGNEANIPEFHGYSIFVTNAEKHEMEAKQYNTTIQTQEVEMMMSSKNKALINVRNSL